MGNESSGGHADRGRRGEKSQQIARDGDNQEKSREYWAQRRVSTAWERRRGVAGAQESVSPTRRVLKQARCLDRVETRTERGVVHSQLVELPTQIPYQHNLIRSAARPLVRLPVGADRERDASLQIAKVVIGYQNLQQKRIENRRGQPVKIY